MSQVVETDFVIMRDEEILYFATYTIVNVSQPSIIVNEHYVVIEYEQIDDENSKLNNKGKEVTNETRARGLGIVIVKLEEVSIPILHCKVYDSDQKEVENCGDPKPGNELAERSWETVNEALRKVTDQDDT